MRKIYLTNMTHPEIYWDKGRLQEESLYNNPLAELHQHIFHSGYRPFFTIRHALIISRYWSTLYGSFQLKMS